MVVALEDGTPVSDGMTAYRLGDLWYLPLTQLMEGLSVDISVSPELGKAEGDFLDPGRHFVLDQAACQAQIRGQIEKFHCPLVVVHNEELFVESKLLESWFPLHFRIDTFASEILIESSLKFPQQARKERERLAQLQASSRPSHKAEAYDFMPVPPRNFAGPIVDQQLSASLDRVGGPAYRQDSAAAMEVLGFETRTFLGGDEKKIDQWSLSFSKKDPQGGLLGSLRAREVQAFDLTLPPIPLVARSTRVRGLLVSSHSLSQPSNFTSRDFRGPLPSGWEVELYQNDLLVGRQVSDTSTEYEFKDVQLVYGVNRFRTVFYGPQGQRREEVETIQIGQNQVQPGKKEYRVALGETIESTGNLTGETRSVLQYQQGLSPNWSFATSLIGSRSALGRTGAAEDKNFGLLGFHGSLSRLFLSLNFASDGGSGHATEQSLQAPFERGAVSLSHTSLSNFQSDLFNLNPGDELKQILKLNLSWSFVDFMSLRMTGEANQRTFVNRQSTAYTQRSSWKTGPFLWFNTFNLDPEANPQLSGQLSSIANLSGYEVRPLMEYSKTVDAIGAAVQRRFTESLTIEVGFRRSDREQKNDYQATLNRIFSGFALSAEANADSNGDYKLTGLLSYSFGSNPSSQKISFSAQPQTDHGAASVFVYLDLDQNGSFGEGDKALNDIQILVNGNNSGTKTDDSGHSFLGKLPAYEFVDLSISAKSLSDPLFKPAKKGIRIIPRPGHVFALELPIIIQNELDGLIQIESEDNIRGRGKMKVHLKDSSGKIVATVKSSSDGFFLIEEVPLGSYELALDPEQLESLGLISRPESHHIEIPASGLVQSSFDFSLKKKP